MSSADRSPADRQSEMSTLSATTFTDLQSRATSFPDSRFPLVTMEKRLIPLFLLHSAASRSLSVSTSGYSLITAWLCADWAHHLQSSGQCPDLPFIIEQVSNTLDAHASVILDAQSQRCPRGATASFSASIPDTPLPVAATLSASWKISI